MTLLRIAELTRVLEEFTRMSIRLPAAQRLSFTTLSVLHTLSTRGPRRLTELTATEQVTQSAITQIVTKLEREGLVRREPDPTDGRAVLVHATPAGTAVIDGRRDERIRRLTELAAGLDPDEQAAIAAALPALAHLVELSQPQPTPRKEPKP
ncbi:MarR family transcriptional regulator [Dactylosporangium sp. AC04546]|uniref:MarR family winged helix-turn-helix transcriptional regulator n=1 Tax=Dactylosporangium sp. AC04546 TaxID=2862460 RepID=UPI001EDE2CB4|nr:MarR family transcriptional regulator [Dactylosporangium sp. AC04546]WVK79823.1 MarR family transcriptional regulator [Dactylosporangium sp. AC04546]